MDKVVVGGVEYSKPKVTLISATPLINAEIAGRVCYDSFDKSEHKQVKNFKSEPTGKIEDIETSSLLQDLCHVHHHTSIVEHVTLSYFIQGTSRGVLQEQARHRIQSLSVESTRYTMNKVIYAYIAAMGRIVWFVDKVLTFDMFVTTEESYNRMQICDIWDKLKYQEKRCGEEEFKRMVLSKSNRSMLSELVGTHDDIFDKLDENRVSHLIELVSGDHFGQVFITDTHPERTRSIIKQVEKPYEIYNLETEN